MVFRHLLRLMLVVSALLVVSSAFADEVAVDAYVPKAPLKKLDLQDGDSFVFLGDSITHQCLYTQYVEDFFYQRMPHIRLKFHNSGVGGARAWDALARFDEDVAAYKPKYVSILLGMNDGTYQSYDQATFDAYHRDMTTVVEKIVAAGATPVLMTPTMYDSRASRMFPRKGRTYSDGLLTQYNGVLIYYGTWLRDVAVEKGYGFVDMWGPLNNLTFAARKTDPTFTMIHDAVHPDAPGQAVMAVALIDDLGLKAPLSNIVIRLPGKAEPKVTAAGGTVSDLKRTETGVEFMWLANGLPWVLPEEADIGVSLTKLGHRNSREAIAVYGLTPGRYELSIDGTVVGAWASEQLSKGVELQANNKTPQYLQALKIAHLNRDRNSGPVKNLRNEWRLFQGYARTKRDAQTDADREKVAQMEKQLEGLSERVAGHAAEAKKIEDAIFEVNQPVARQYVLTRIVAQPKAAGTQ
ncbi:MAG: SGNH/GDSL hydrolase family protein [Rhodopirellula sp.]|nr:SGNH/GDSL hydrolase family protein [Rhodopirellula sp.]